MAVKNLNTSSVRRILRSYLEHSLDIGLPVKYEYKKSKIAAAQKIDYYIHVDKTYGIQEKKGDYFSMSPHIIYETLAKQPKKDESDPRSYFGLPTSKEVGQDLIVQIPDNDVIQAMEVENFFFEDTIDPFIKERIPIKNGHHINFYLKDSFIEQQVCKLQKNLFKDQSREIQEHLKKKQINFSQNFETLENYRKQQIIQVVKILCANSDIQFESVVDSNLPQNYIEYLLQPDIKQETVLNQKVIQKKHRIANLLTSKGLQIDLQQMSQDQLKLFEIESFSNYSLLFNTSYMPEKVYRQMNDKLSQQFQREFDQIVDLQPENAQEQFMVKTDLDREAGMLLLYLRDSIEDFHNSCDMMHIREISLLIFRLVQAFHNKRQSLATQKAISESLSGFLTNLSDYQYDRKDYK
eukprot:403364498